MGRKRKSAGASLAALLAGRKRLQPEQHASGDWASLPTDMVSLVADRLLDDGDVTDYICFRAVCSFWRASTLTPTERDPGMRDPRLRPRAWVALCDGDAVRPDDAGEIDLFHTRTSRRLRLRVPDLVGDRRIINFSDGLLILLHKATAEIRVLNLFTRAAIDFPSLASVYDDAIKDDMRSFLAMNAAVCSAASSSSSSSIAVVVWFPHTESVPVVAAEAGSHHHCWEILHRGFTISNTLVFQGRLYATTMACSLEIVQLYPPIHRRRPKSDLPVAVARAPNIFHYPVYYNILLVESGGKMLLVVRHYVNSTGAYLPANWWQRECLALYEVDLNSNGGGGGGGGGVKLTPVSCLHDRALILSTYGCMSVSAIDLPSLRRNSIYFSEPLHPVLVHSLTTGLSEELAVEWQIHDGKERIRPSVRPFTIIDHLLTFCHPQEWTKGLMFHEYHNIPLSFKELWKNIRANESQLRIPPIPSGSSSAVSEGKLEKEKSTERW